MSIPGMSGGMLSGAAGAGELPPMSIPGMSCGIGASVGAGVLPLMSIPGISAGMLAVGAGGLSDPTATGTTAALSGLLADASCRAVSISDPTALMPPIVAPTDATRNRRHRKASLADRLQ